jgi:hypothetical protein
MTIIEALLLRIALAFQNCLINLLRFRFYYDLLYFKVLFFQYLEIKLMLFLFLASWILTYARMFASSFSMFLIYYLSGPFNLNSILSIIIRCFSFLMVKMLIVLNHQIISFQLWLFLDALNFLFTLLSYFMIKLLKHELK